MHTLCFSDSPQQHYRIQQRPGDAVVQVDQVGVEVRSEGQGRYAARMGRGSERVYAHAHGDVVHVQWRGCVWRINRVDLSRAGNDTTATDFGSLMAPMPGVVVSCQVEIGQLVCAGDSLLVIESMKLQSTISASANGVVAELPLATGQTFERGALLARIAQEQVLA